MIKRFDSSDKNVFKYVLTTEDAVAEAVAYRYGSFEERTVVCCSIQSGCPVGCTFCGTGSKFIRNLTVDEIVNQVEHVIKDQNIMHWHIKKFQIMFMSMGEPMLNIDNLVGAIRKLNKMYPQAQLLISTVGIKDEVAASKIIDISREIDKVGLQFSIHESTDEKRDSLIPFKNKLTLREIRDFGTVWYIRTGRKPFLNYCVTENNCTDEDFQNMTNLFSPAIHNLTFSVVCTADETLAGAWDNQLEKVKKFSDRFVSEGYDVRVFNPAGQDDIGGGCGQLWYVQDWMKNHNK